MELIFGVFNNRLFEKKILPAPDILIKYKVNPHIFVPNSILYVVTPSKEYRSFGHGFKTNSFGFRDKEFSLKKRKNTFRILVFGDSMTFGVGIDTDHRYTNLLEEMLNIKEKGRYEVLKFGMGGYSTDQERDLMEAILKVVECDLVIVGFCCDDLQMTTKKKLASYTNLGQFDRMNMDNINIKYDVFYNSKRNLKTIPYDEPKSFGSPRPWYKESILFKYFLEQRTNINIEEKLPNSARWNYNLNELKKMKAVTEKYKLPKPVVVLLNYGSVDPDDNDFVNPVGELAQYIHFYKFVGNRLRNEGFNVVKTLPLFEKYSGMSMAVSEWEFHSNYLGHYIYAKSIYDYLISHGLI